MQVDWIPASEVPADWHGKVCWWWVDRRDRPPPVLVTWYSDRFACTPEMGRGVFFALAELPDPPGQDENSERKQ